ncbi:hypothetical protein [Devosia sp. A449]
MSSFVRRFTRLFTTSASPHRLTRDPDTMSLRDWADLPVHHPYCDRAPR